MAIKIDADARMQGQEANSGRTEEVYLPGPIPGSDEEGPFDFAYQRMGSILAMQRKLKNINDVQAVLESQRVTFKWLAGGFGPAAWAHITARLDDEDDLLDDEHMQFLFVELTKASTGGRPTTSSNGAARQPWKRPSTVAPSQQESDSVS